ncbi:MAG: hypothetical protein OXB86_02965 [Bdellovibrionales bacterium]|nr:hypothetical protein [Bdellovibrionales bacterium]
MVKKRLLRFINPRVFKSLFMTLIVSSLSFPSWGDIQYKPISSPERHEFTGSFAFKTPIQNFASRHRALSLNYSLYFPEITAALLPEPWSHIGAPGLSLGATLFKVGHEFCTQEKEHPLFTHLGFKAKFSYFEAIIPFAEYGMGWMSCIKNLTLDKEAEVFRHSPGPMKLKTYFALGLNLSFKILDKKSMYSLDRDYGLNDIALQGQCRWYQGTEKTLTLCEIGLSVLF